MHLVEAASPRLVTLLSVTDDVNSYVAPISLLPTERTRKVRTVSGYHLELIVHCSEKISSTNHSNDFLVYRLFVNSVEVNRLVLRLVEFHIFYKHIKVDNIDS